MSVRGRISIHATPELQELRRRLTGLDKAMRSQINRQSKEVIQPVWKRAIAERLHTRFDTRMLHDSATASVTPRQVTLKAAQTTKKLSGGLVPKTNYALAEFGVPAPKDHTRAYTEARSRTGRAYIIKNRHTRRGLPMRYRHGRIVYPAFAEVVPRVASLWVQTAMRTVREVIDG